MQNFQGLIKVLIFFILNAYSNKLYNNVLSSPLVNGFRFKNKQFENKLFTLNSKNCHGK